MNRKKVFLVFTVLMLVLGVCIANFGFNTSSSSNIKNNTSTSIPTSDTTIIALKETTAEFIGKNVNIMQNGYYGTIVEINGSGTYIIQGSLSKGFISVSEKGLNVTIILNGVNIVSKNYAALTSLKKSRVILVLAENTVNSLSDGSKGAVNSKYYQTYNSKKQPNATLLAHSNLTIRGSGKLIVNSRFNHGIRSRAGLKIEGGEIEVNAAKNALKGNNEIIISGGILELVSGNDAVQASTSLSISNATLKIKTGGGSNVLAIAGSAKGLKAATDITIDSGTFDIDSNDDGIHSDGTLTINNGTFAISSGDDAIRSEKRLTVNGGTINITKCYEGLESYNIDLNGGFVRIKSSDDGINISGGGRVGDTEAIIDGTLTITGGEYHVESEGDAVDSNGNIEMSGGTIVAFGPTSTGSTDRSIDFDLTFTMTGGLLVGLGYTTDKMKPPALSDTAQYAFLAAIDAVPAGTLINVSSDSGTEVLTVKTLGSTRSLLVCSPLLGKGTYIISSGGSHSGSANALGLYEGGVYSGGSVVKTFTISETTTDI
ncbi:MAG: carbohydrate-binding domain-containing protein [Candidatus Fibromonas sp.]|jgi:hypothetical protein|nr:carbohydrate-binding domain-containing protein [Candidatus Fibromonas sp.]